MASCAISSAVSNSEERTKHEQTLLHTCCAPCSVSCVEQLRTEGIEPIAYWFNPNIHPYQEYKARRDTLIGYADQIGMELIVQEDYGLRGFVCAVAEDIDHRCEKCYEMRLEQAANLRRKTDFPPSPPPCSSVPISSMNAWQRLPPGPAKKWGVEFLYRDFRPGFRGGQQQAGSWGCICRNTVAASSARRTGMLNKSPETGQYR